MNRYDVIVIGGGLLGCFAARNLTRYKLKIALLERREDLCTGISRANTAIVYSGYDMKPGTLKAKMCVQAAQGFGELCAELGVRYSPCGSVMVCFGPRGAKILRQKYEQGIENGVQGIRLLNPQEVLELEPNLNPRVVLGLYAPEAGTVIPWELGIAAAENALQNGADILLNSEVTDITPLENGFKVSCGSQTFWTRGIINCAGLAADEILEKVSSPKIRIFPSGGDYLVLDTKAGGYIRHVIFHEPEQKGKGLTLVPTVEGNILLGPSEVPIEDKDSFATSSEGLAEIKALVSEVIPSLPLEHVIRSFGAIRPNPYWVHLDPLSGRYVPEDKGINSFTILESSPGPFLSLIGIKTPGLTCANELGKYVANKMAEALGDVVPNPAFNPKRPAPLRLNDLPLAQRARLVEENPLYGKIVCRCRKITEGEIVDSIRRKPGAVTIDGVKRRTGSGTGRCQGSFCTQRIIEILARELGCSPAEICKDGKGSYVIRNMGNSSSGKKATRND
ncbi:MAG: NAD(P)/FAD-dependent oxidoreductase [Peptococcaceae bacterium]|nr:NAD(P)/FAD-dependent oxidoreductase [Peptococcaceae bacterium]